MTSIERHHFYITYTGRAFNRIVPRRTGNQCAHVWWLKPALTFDGSCRPVPLSVPDPVAFAGLATRSGHWEFEDHEIEAFPELAIQLDLGQRMLSQLA